MGSPKMCRGQPAWGLQPFWKINDYQIQLWGGQTQVPWLAIIENFCFVCLLTYFYEEYTYEEVEKYQENVRLHFVPLSCIFSNFYFFRIFSNYVVESHTIRTRSMFVNGENYSHASASKGRLMSPYADARILGCKNSAHIYNMCLQTFWSMLKRQRPCTYCRSFNSLRHNDFGKWARKVAKYECFQE